MKDEVCSRRSEEANAALGLSKRDGAVGHLDMKGLRQVSPAIEIG